MGHTVQSHQVLCSQVQLWNDSIPYCGGGMEDVVVSFLSSRSLKQDPVHPVPVTQLCFQDSYQSSYLVISAFPLHS